VLNQRKVKNHCFLENIGWALS